MRGQEAILREVECVGDGVCVRTEGTAGGVGVRRGARHREGHCWGQEK